MNDKDVTIIDKQPLTSALKIVYLCFFVYTASTIFSAFVSHIPEIGESIKANTLPTLDGLIFIIVLFFLPVAVGLHFVRIYLTMEMLEDPTSPFHKKYLTRLSSDAKFKEQLLRFSAIILVSFKLIEKICGFEVLNQLHGLCAYLVAFYFSLLLWDLWIYCCHKKIDPNFSLIEDTYFRMNAFSMMAAIFAFYLALGIVKSYFILALALLCIIAAIFMSFYYDYKDKKKSSDNCVFWRELVFWSDLKDIMKNIKTPYYGDQYVVSREKIFRDNTNKPFSGSCDSDNCRYQEGSIQVLKKIDN